MGPAPILTIAVAVGVLVLWWLRLHVLTTVLVRDYERALLYRGGELQRVLEVGVYRLLGLNVDAVVVDMREQRTIVPGQEILTADQVGVRVSLVLIFKVTDPEAAIHASADYRSALYADTQIALRNSAAERSLDELLEQRASIGDVVAEAARSSAADYGVDLVSVKVRDIMLPGDIRQAFSEVVRARQLGLAAVERARAETAALRNLNNVSALLRENPGLWHARLLQLAAEGKEGAKFVLSLPGAPSTPELQE